MLDPLAVMDVGEAVMVDVAVLAAPGVNATTSLSVIATPPRVPVIVELPAVVEEVNVAVYVPFPLSVMEESDPEVVPSATVAPPAVRLFPFVSFS